MGQVIEFSMRSTNRKPIEDESHEHRGSLIEFPAPVRDETAPENWLSSERAEIDGDQCRNRQTIAVTVYELQKGAGHGEYSNSDSCCPA